MILLCLPLRNFPLCVKRIAVPRHKEKSLLMPKILSPYRRVHSHLLYCWMQLDVSGLDFHESRDCSNITAVSHVSLDPNKMHF